MSTKPFYLDFEKTVVSVVEGILNSISNPEYTCICIQIQDDILYRFTDEEYEKVVSESDEEDIMMISSSYSRLINHNFLFYSPSNYVKVFYNNHTQFGLTKDNMFVDPKFYLVSNHDSAWRNDGFVHCGPAVKPLYDDLVKAVYNKFNKNITYKDLTRETHIENCFLADIDKQKLQEELLYSIEEKTIEFYFKRDGKYIIPRRV